MPTLTVMPIGTTGHENVRRLGGSLQLPDVIRSRTRPIHLQTLETSPDEHGQEPGQRMDGRMGPHWNPARFEDQSDRLFRCCQPCRHVRRVTVSDEPVESVDHRTRVPLHHERPSQMGTGDGRSIGASRIEDVGHLDEKPLAAEATHHLVYPALTASHSVPTVRLDCIRLWVDEVPEDGVFPTLMGTAHFDARDELEGGIGRSL